MLERSRPQAKKRTAPFETQGELAPPSINTRRQDVPAPPLDGEVLAALRQFQLEGETDIVQEMGEAYALETPQLLETLRQAVTEGKPDQLRRAAHNIKGSSNNLGATNMATLSAALESLGKQGTFSGAADIVTRLDYEYQHVMQALVVEKTGNTWG